MTKKRQSLADDIAELVALMPWWAGVALALVSYLFLHRIASAPLPAAVPGQVASMVSAGMWKGLATGGQYLLPLLCLVGSAMSWWRRRERRRLVRDVVAQPSAAALQNLTWRQFEKLVGEIFRMQGYDVTETGSAAGDGGVDLSLRKDRETYLVQCKKWKAHKVGVEAVRELHGVMAARGATGGFVVTSGRFTREASQFANGLNIRLIDGEQLQALALKTRSASATPPTAAASADDDAPPACPECRRRMVRRVAKRGTREGQPFWGCVGYPQCRGTRSITAP